jgi:hypothetical protein
MTPRHQAADSGTILPAPERPRTLRPCPRCKRSALLPPWRCCQRCEPNEVTRREMKQSTKQRILTACREAEKKGWKIRPGATACTTHGRKHCCPLGAVCVVAGTDLLIDQARRHLRTGAMWTRGFWVAFDARPVELSRPRRRDHQKLYLAGARLGRAIRKELGL